MDTILQNLLGLISGFTCGFILFQSAIVAPSVFSTLPSEQAGPFLRTLFPKLFKTCLGFMILNFFIALYLDATTIYVGSFICGMLMVICLVLVPKINTARDEGNEIRFQRLHLATVISTLLVLGANVFFVFA